MKIEMEQSRLVTNIFLGLITLLAGSTLSAQDLSGVVEQQRQVIGCVNTNSVRIKSIVIDKKNVEAATQVEVIRKLKPNEKEKGEGNMELFPGDTVITLKQTQIKVLFCGELGAHEVEILEDSKIVIGNPRDVSATQSRIFQNTGYSKSVGNRQLSGYWWFICPVGYIYVKGKGYFKVETRGRSAGSRRTEYTLEIPKDQNSDVTLNVIEGVVGISLPRTPLVPTTTTQAYYKAAVFLQNEECPQDEICVRELEVAKFNVNKNVEILPPEAANELIRQDINKSSDAHFNTLPKFPAQGIIPDPEYPNHEARRQAFMQARTAILVNELNVKNGATNTFSNNDLGKNYETLGKIYAELGLGEKALREFNTAASYYQKEANWQPPPDFRAARAEAYIFAACTEKEKECANYLVKAEADVQQAITESKNSIPVIAALINLNLRKSLEALVKNEVKKAENLIEELEDLVEEPLIEKIRKENINQISGGQKKSALLTLVGEVYLRLGDVDLAESKEGKEKPSHALKEYKKAETACSEASQLDPLNLYALKCLGDVKREQAIVIREQIFSECKEQTNQEQTSVGKKNPITECIQKKKNSYESLFKDSVEQYNKALTFDKKFSPALYDLATLFRIRKGREIEANKNYEMAIKLDQKAFSQKFIFPDITCKTKADAARLISDIGLVPKDKIGQADPSGLYVTGQTSKNGEVIKAGDVVEKGAEINLILEPYVSPEQCSINNLST